MATMAEVIDEATKRYRALTIVSDPEIRGVRQHEYIAAAVDAHMLLPETIERAAKAARPDAWAEDGEIGKVISVDAKANYYAGLRKVLLGRARAAIRAALGEHEGVGR